MILRQRGVGLVEVLIAVLVLAFGMLGLVGLQLFTLKSNQSSFERGLAVVHTHSIIDALRADRNAAVNGQFNIGLDDDAPAGTAFTDTALATWRANLIAGLGPNATGSVDCDGSACTILVQWNDQRAGGEENMSFATEVEL